MCDRKRRLPSPTKAPGAVANQTRKAGILYHIPEMVKSMKNSLKEQYGERFLTEEEFGELELNEDVDRIENNGISGINPSWIWYTCYMVDGTEFDFYG